jgi:hypothetical protein
MPRTHSRSTTRRKLTLAAALCALASLALGLAAGSRAETTPRTDSQAAASAVSLNLSDFGAKGDGATDDGPAFQPRSTRWRRPAAARSSCPRGATRS